MGSIKSFLPLILIVAVFYLFLIRPQQKQRKKEKQFSEDLKKGDKVVTKSGMYGKVLGFSEKTDAVILETGAGKITFDRSSISLDLSEKRNKPQEQKK